MGSVQLKNGQSGGLAKISFSRINGDLQFESNDARMVANNNTVGANLQAVQNEGGVELTGNTIAENLQCKENEPPRPAEATRPATKRTSAPTSNLAKTFSQ